MSRKRPRSWKGASEKPPSAVQLDVLLRVRLCGRQLNWPLIHPRASRSANRPVPSMVSQRPVKLRPPVVGTGPPPASRTEVAELRQNLAL